MSAIDAVHAIEQHFAAFLESARAVAEQHLPEAASVVQAVAANPAMQALAVAVHLPEAPEVLAELAATIGKIDEALGAAKAQQPPADPAAPAA